MTKGTFDVASLMSPTKTVTPDTSKPVATTNNTTTQTTTTTSTGDAGKATVKEVVDAYKADKVAAASKYKGKTLTITGKVAGYSATEFTVTVTSGDPNEQGAKCVFTSAYKSSISALEPGQDVTIQGKVGDFVVDLTITDCSFIR